MLNAHWFHCSNPKACLVIRGHPVIEKLDFEGLTVGDQIDKIGNSRKGGMAMLNREDNFVSCVTYSGIVKTKMISIDKEETEIILFRVQEKESNSSDPTYIGYIVLRHSDENSIELKVMDHKYNTVNVYKPIFKLHLQKP